MHAAVPLHWWAWNVSVTAIHATQAFFWLDQCVAFQAVIKINAGVARHLIMTTLATMRASDRRKIDGLVPGKHPHTELEGAEESSGLWHDLGVGARSSNADMTDP
jgi:hypothetical protein